MNRAVFCDTSGFYAVLDKDDQAHKLASAIWRRLIENEHTLITTNYILIETMALVQHRLGIAATRGLLESIQPLLHIIWIDEQTHLRAAQAVITANRRTLSFVDCTSFDTMREQKISWVFTFDKHFEEQGFDRLKDGASAT